MKILYAYLSMIGIFVIMDLGWLGYLAKNFYQTKLDHLLSQQVVWGAAIVFYLIFLAGILYFVVLQAKSLPQAILNGALLGGLCYATYDLTNWATLKAWPAEVVVVDILWGMVITASCATVGYLVYQS